MSQSIPQKITIAIDGYSSTGKSTLAKNLAKALSYRYIDTGAMYRCVALYALTKGWVQKERIDVEALVMDLSKIDISFEYDAQAEKNTAYLQGENVEDRIRTLEVSSYVSLVSAIPQVRKHLVSIQQEMGKAKAVVMDGRDIGSVVFPEAELKIFMTANPEIRAKRRWEELKNKGESSSLVEVQQNLLERDHLDMTRAESPLIQCDDARELDNSNISREDQFELALGWAKALIYTSH